MEQIFKAGDRVIFTGNTPYYPDFTIGKEYVLGGKFFIPSKPHFAVVADDSGEENGLPRATFELVKDLVGVKFKHKYGSCEYTLLKKEGNIYTISWKDGSATYPEKDVLEYFEEGTWIKTENMKEIIGYKLIKTQYEDSAVKIVKKEVCSAFTEHEEYKITKTFPVQGYTRTITALKDAGVLDLWFEPVYKEIVISKNLVLGTQKRKVIVFKDRVEMIDGGGDKRVFNNSSLKELLNLFGEESFNGFSIKPTKFQIGCSAGIEISIEDLELITKTQSEL